MNILVNSALFGILVLLAYKVVGSFLKFLHVCRYLRCIPQKPSHWLFGHGQEVTDSVTYLKYTCDVMNNGGNMYCVWNGPYPILGVCHPELFKQLIRQENAKARGFPDGYRFMEPWIGDGLLLSSGKKWERNRRLLTPAFHFDILSGYIDIMNDVAHLFLDKLDSASKTGESVDVYPFVCRSTLDAMLKCSLSYDGSMQNEQEHSFVQAIHRLSVLVWTRLSRPMLWSDIIFYMSRTGREWRRLIDTAHKFTGAIIQKRKSILDKQLGSSSERRRLDFLDILLTARDEQGNGLSDQAIQDEVDTFTFEGHDTTASAIAWAIYALGQHPEIQQKVYTDVHQVLDEDRPIGQSDLSRFTYLHVFIKEVMRFYSPVPLVARKHSQPIVLDGKEIPVGPRVDINIYAMHHNPRIWRNPEEFNPDRFKTDNRDDVEVFGFIPFSAGARNCIGQVFAMNEMKITIASLVKRFEVRAVAGHKACLVPDVVMRSANGMPVILTKRTKSCHEEN